jgi:DNA-binding MarR family transcriptional regulator
MTDRFPRTLLRNARDKELPPSLGEIGLNNFAPYLTNRIMARWNANVAEELKDFDLTTTQMRALAVLSVSSSLTVNELSIFAVTEQSTMSRTLDSLEEQGYIRRQPRRDDMRVRNVSITTKGRSAFEKVWPILHRMQLQMFDGVEEEEYRNFLGTLHKVLRNIRKHDI